MPMLLPFLDMEILRKLTLIVFIFCVLIAFKNQDAETKKGSSSTTTTPSSIVNWSTPFSFRDNDLSILLTQFASYPDVYETEEDEGFGREGKGSIRGLEYDFYRDSCPQAEKIIREAVWDMYRVKSSVAPALLRLAFHDCFIGGCDSSILLDGRDSEKNSPPNDGMRGYTIIDIIKSELENVCPGVVSCADIIVLAAREGVVQAGGPFYPLYTGRRDGIRSFRDMATEELPSPHADLTETLETFALRGFDARETVSLLGAHSIGVIHCKFFQDRLYNFAGTDNPDPTVDTAFLDLLRSRCMNSTIAAPASPPFHTSPSPAPLLPSHGPKSSTAPAPSFISSPPPSSNNEMRRSRVASSAAPLFPPKRSSSLSKSAAPSGCLYESLLSSFDDPAMDMAYEGPGVDFGTLYYHSLLQGKGILYSDQQLMAAEETGIWVRAYASDVSLFRRDFAMAMMKLSNLRVLTGSMGQVRHNCSKLA